jgi:hypothetical protein
MQYNYSVLSNTQKTHPTGQTNQIRQDRWIVCAAPLPLSFFKRAGEEDFLPRRDKFLVRSFITFPFSLYH